MLLLYLEKNMPLKMIVSPEKVFRLSSFGQFVFSISF